MNQLKGLGWMKGCALALALIWWIAPELLLEQRWLMLIPVGVLWRACHHLKKKIDEQQRYIEYTRDRLRHMERHKND